MYFTEYSFLFKLFKANKDWHTKWEQLRQSKQAEQEELASRLKAAEEEIERLKAEAIALKSKAQEEKVKTEVIIKTVSEPTLILCFLSLK